MTKKKKMIIGITSAVVLIAAVGLFFGLKNKNTSGANTVYVQKVSSITGGGTVFGNRYAGIVESQDSVKFKADSSRKVLEVYVESGQSVNKGDNLFAYDVSDNANNIASANLEIEGLYQQIDALNGDIAELEAQRKNASQQDQYQYTSDIQSKEMDIRQAQLDIQNKQAEIARNQQEVDRAVVKSTITGTVDSVNPNGGMDGNGNELPIVSVTETGDLRVKGLLDEQSIGMITNGTEVIVRSRIDESDIRKGTVSQVEVKPAEDNSSNVSSSTSEISDQASKYPFYVSLEDSSGLLLGQHVYIEPNFGQMEVQEGIHLDLSYIVDAEGTPYVWADKNGKLEKRNVELGQVDSDSYTAEIVSGLSEDDKIAWPDDTLKAGMKTTGGE